MVTTRFIAVHQTLTFDAASPRIRKSKTVCKTVVAQVACRQENALERLWFPAWSSTNGVFAPAV